MKTNNSYIVKILAICTLNLLIVIGLGSFVESKKNRLCFIPIRNINIFFIITK
jgi:hypothetical protein